MREREREKKIYWKVERKRKIERIKKGWEREWMEIKFKEVERFLN